MPLRAYEFRFPDGDFQATLNVPATEALRKVMRAFDLSDLFLVPHWDGCDAFAAGDGDLPDCKAFLQELNRSGAYKCSSKLICRMYEERDAVRWFLKLAGGISGGKREKRLIELVRKAYLAAVEAALIGPVLHRLFQRGIWLHEKVRLKTDYFNFAVDEQSVLRELAEKIFGNLQNAAVLCLGSFPLLPEFIEALYRAGCRAFSYIGEEAQFHSLQTNAAAFLQKVRPSTILPPDSDILLIGNGVSACPDDEVVASRMAARKNSPLMIVYGAGSIALKKRYNVFQYSLEQFEQIIAHNREEQSRVAAEIAPMLEKEIDEFYAWQESEERHQFAGMVGAAPEMQRLFELISRIAQTDTTVIVQGESGTGKELVARAIHNLSGRAQKPFVVVNCGAIPENLLESELFGHVRGAFTGAVAHKRGLFEEANHGTIFLDEIAELPLHLQVKLLRFLQEGEIKQVGSNTNLHLDVRVLAATNRNLEQMMEDGLFRSDLYYRLNVIQLNLPPLRDRRKDIILLARHFLKKYTSRFNKQVQGFTPEAQELLMQYPWPGNIRELENAIEHATALAVGETITVFDLPEALRSYASNGRTRPAHPRTLKEVEKQHILETLDLCEWNYEKASQVLGIGRTTLWRKLREYNLQK